MVELCKKYRHDGVVAIDLAGDESMNLEANPEHRTAYKVSMENHEDVKNTPVLAKIIEKQQN